MYEEKIPFKRLGTVEEGYGQERQAAGKQIQILNTGNQTVRLKQSVPKAMWYLHQKPIICFSKEDQDLKKRHWKQDF